MPNETWQSDFTHYRLTHPDGRPGPDVEIITWLDDHSRYALHVTCHRAITAIIVRDTFRQAGDKHGYPASTLSDNGMVYTVRFATGRGGRTALENELRERGIRQKNGQPNHPQTQGKVERFQQTLNAGSTPNFPSPPRCPSCSNSSTPSSTPTTTSDPTGPCHTGPPPPPPTKPDPKPPPAPTAAPTPRPCPYRQSVQSRLHHPAPHRPVAPHRSRANLRRNLRSDPHPGP